MQYCAYVQHKKVQLFAAKRHIIPGICNGSEEVCSVVWRTCSSSHDEAKKHIYRVVVPLEIVQSYCRGRHQRRSRYIVRNTTPCLARMTSSSSSSSCLARQPQFKLNLSFGSREMKKSRTPHPKTKFVCSPSLHRLRPQTPKTHPTPRTRRHRRMYVSYASCN